MQSDPTSTSKTLESREEPSMDSQIATTPTEDTLDYAWTIIANAGGGDWTKEAQDWQDAAARLRDQYHADLNRRRERRDG